MKTKRSHGNRIQAGLTQNHDPKEGLPRFRCGSSTEIISKSAGSAVGFWILVICFLFVGFVKLGATPSTGTELMRLVREQNSSTSQISHVSLELTDKKGRSQKRQLKVWVEQTDGSENTLTRFTDPKRVAGVGFLVINKEENRHRYLYTAVGLSLQRQKSALRWNQ